MSPLCPRYAPNYYAASATSLSGPAATTTTTTIYHHVCLSYTSIRPSWSFLPSLRLYDLGTTTPLLLHNMYTGRIYVCR